MAGRGGLKYQIFWGGQRTKRGTTFNVSWEPEQLSLHACFFGGTLS